MNILVIDGQGGGIGKSLVERLRAALPQAEILAVGTNAAATANMLRAGATVGATGENAVVYNSAHAGIIAGPIGIILSNAMMGEITPAMAGAVSSSPAQLVLVPVAKCRAHVVGVEEKPLARYLDDAVAAVLQLGKA